MRAIKPAYRDRVLLQLNELQNPRICVAEIGRVYEW